MPLSDAMKKHLNEQVAAELYSAYLYLGLSFDLEKLGLPGFAHWLKCQYSEENGHAIKIANYMLEKDSSVELQNISASSVVWECPCEAMQAALEHEKLVTKQIEKVMAAAREESDFGTELFMSWFIKEQHEEETTLVKINNHFKFFGEDNNGLTWLDQELGRREKLS